MQGRRISWPVGIAVAALALIAALLILRSGGTGGSGDSGEPLGTSASAGSGSGGTRFVRRGDARARRPNVILMSADDLGLIGWRRGMPRTRELLGAGGTELTESIVSTPLCCPSRAAMLTGRYGHNNGVLANDPGYPALVGKTTVLPARLAAAGYRTAMVGKFMNGWSRTAPGERGEAAPGWDEWVEMRRTFGYYDYELNVGGDSRSYGSEQGDYLTDVLTGHALDVIDDAADDPEPLFMWMSWWAPHPELSGATGGPCQGSAIPRSREPGDFAAERLPQIASVDEKDIADKPAFLRERRDLRPGDRMGARQSLRCRTASLAGIERGVEAIVERLRTTGQLEDTVIIFTSDNGFFHLEHRLPNGKALPYEEAIRVPLLIDLPDRWGRQLTRNDIPVSNIDLAPTILELAGACGDAACADLDGASLLPLLSPGVPGRLQRRALLVEADAGKPCGFTAVRTEQFMYAEYEERRRERRCPAGQRELYSLREDPHQLDNRLHGSTPDPPRGVEADLQRTLRRLERCSGRSCGAAGTVPAGVAP